LIKLDLIRKLKKSDMIVIYHELGAHYLHRKRATGDWRIKTFLGEMYADNDAMADQLIQWTADGYLIDYEIIEEGAE